MFVSFFNIYLYIYIPYLYISIYIYIYIYIYLLKKERNILAFFYVLEWSEWRYSKCNEQAMELPHPTSLTLPFHPSFTVPHLFSLVLNPSPLLRHLSFQITHPSSLIPHPFSFIPHPSYCTTPPSPHLPHPSLLIPHPCILFHLTPLLPHPCSLTYSSYCTPVPLPPPPAHPIFTGSTTLHKSLPVSVPNSIIRENWVSELKNLMTLSL